MLQIAICDDVVEQTLVLQNYVREYCERRKIEYKLYIYTSGIEMLADAEKMVLFS